MHDFINNKIIPAFEFITNQHSESNIKTFLSRVKDYYEDEIAPFMVVDESWASINAICTVFNSCDILSYINWTWDLLMTQTKETHNKFECFIKTRIILCHVHLLKNFLYKCDNLIKKVIIKHIFPFLFSY